MDARHVDTLLAQAAGAIARAREDGDLSRAGADALGADLARLRAELGADALDASTAALDDLCQRLVRGCF